MYEILRLLVSRRLGPLCLSQACGALNDNLVKNALVVLVMFGAAREGPEMAAIAGGLFILPYILLSATAGQLADRFDKSRLIFALKIFEVVLMVAAAIGFIQGSIPLLFAVLLGLGLQATFFGPVKYGILPDHLDEVELVAGNGLMEATTFLAILVGTTVGGAVILLPNGPVFVSVAGVVISLCGLLSARQIPLAPAADPDLIIRWNVFAETISAVRHAKTIRPVWLSILGLSWFWTVGSAVLSMLPMMARDTLGLGAEAVTIMLTVFALGIGAGSMLSAVLLKGKVSARFVPFAALGISLFAYDLGSATIALHASASPQALLSLHGIQMLLDLGLLAMCGGLFSVPLYALVQDKSEPSRRSRTIAANNVVNAIFMVISALFVAGAAWFGIGAPRILQVLAAVNLSVAIWIMRILPQEVFRVIFRWYFDTFHGVDVVGMDNYWAAGDRVIIVANHQSFADASLISAYLPDSPTFAVHTRTAGFWWARPFLAAVDIFKVDIQSPYSIKLMVEAVRDNGRKLMIFPEGRLTKTGALMKIYEGAAVVADKSGAVILPISIDGLQFTHLGRMRGKLKLRWFPRLRITVMPPVSITPLNANTMPPRERRQVVGRALQDLLVDTVFRAKPMGRTLFSSMLDARHSHGRDTKIIEDVARTPMDYDKLLLGSVALGRALSRLASPGDRVGLLLPNSNGAVVTFMGMQAFSLVPAMLNVSAGADGMMAACEAAGVKTVICSRQYVAKAKLDAAIERMSAVLRVVWLEDVRAGLGTVDKLHAKWDSFRARSLPGAVASPDIPAVVLFTSGSEGAPKGVVLSHRNIGANIAQLSSVVDFNSADRVFNAMPMFHSFGLTGGTLLPILSGVRTFLYPSPLHYRAVPALIYDTDATICFGTDTFLSGWARYAHPYDFYSMRYVFAGAEKVREQTKKLYAERFGVRILEGYGTTETSPALSMNTAMHSKSGTVGRFLPGVEWRLETVAGIDQGGRLLVRGPNVMMGYMRTSAPGVIEGLSGGWYDTGDIVELDTEGFVSIKGRAKRFAKIAGEMVSMTAAEGLATSLWPDAAHAVVGLPHERKGEMLVLITTQQDAEAKTLLTHARAKGIPEIMVPRSVMVVDAIPLLGTGKTDYPGIIHLATQSLVLAS